MHIQINKIKIAKGHPLFKEKGRNRNKQRVAVRNIKLPIVYQHRDRVSYFLLVGIRQLQLAKKSGDEALECDVVARPSGKRRQEYFLTERYRASVNSPISMAKNILEHRQRYNMSKQEMAIATGITAGSLHHYESLLSRLAPELRDLADKYKLTFKEARSIADLKEISRQLEIAKPFLDGRLSSMHVEKLVSLAKKYPEKTVANLMEDLRFTKTKKREAPALESTPSYLLEAPVRKSSSIEDQAMILSSDLEQIRLAQIPDYRRLRLISSLRILGSHLQATLTYLNEPSTENQFGTLASRRLRSILS